jgi:multiple sugar transport system substrate-binding protein
MWRFLCGALLVFAAFAVAQSGNQPEPTNPDAPILGFAQTLQVWTWQPSGADLAEDFGIENPEVRLDVRRFDSGAELYQALLTVIRNGGEGAPDAIRLEYAFLPLLQHYNALLDLEPALSAEDRASIPAWAWKQVGVARDLYAVPVDTSPLALVYRADLLEKFKVTLPQTWAQLVAASEKVFKASSGKTRFFNFDPSSSLWFLVLAHANGARVWESSSTGYTQRLNHANALRLADTLEPLLTRGRVTRFASGSLEHHRALRDGTLVSSALPLSVAVSLSKVLRVPGAAKYRIAPLPGGSSADWGGSGCAVTAQTQQAELATQYCLWLSRSQTAQRKSWQRDGLLPAASKVTLEPALVPNLNAFFNRQDVGLAFTKLAAKVQSQTWVPWLPMTDAVYRKLMVSVTKNDLSLSEALERWQATVLVEARKAGFVVK